MSFASVRLSGKPADREHPYGHGRSEYIANLIVALMILLVGINLLRSSIERLVSPVEVTASVPGSILLAASILVKFALFLYFRASGRKADLPVLLLTAKDALFDCLTTLITLTALVLAPHISFNIDAWAALALSLLILITAVRQLLNSASPLLGMHTDDQLTESLTDLALRHKQVLSVHDVRLHDYGYHLYVGSMHIELPESLTFHDAHAIADSIEQEALESLNIQLVIHADPVAVNDPLRDEMLHAAQDILQSSEIPLSLHDFRLDQSESPSVLSFDLEFPFQTDPAVESHVREKLEEALHRILPEVLIRIHIDHS